MTLIDALDAELSARYPEPGPQSEDLDFEQDALEPGDARGAFLVGYIDGRPVACGGVRCLGDGTAEIESMYVRPDVRGRGFARSVLRELTQIALDLGMRRLVLEAGTHQPEALSLYRGAGFAQIDSYGLRRKLALSICLGKELV
jgi:GNAT superfamily N-acetyltransferase